jgi:molybdenum cofactor guanylyltransferase
MGQDKALLQWQGQSLLARAKDTLQAICSSVVISGDYPGEPCIGDNGGGPLAGIAAVQQCWPGHPLLLLPVDMPLVTPALLRLLLATDSTTGAAFAGSLLPLLLRPQPQLASLLAQLLASAEPRQRSLHALVAVLALPLLTLPAALLPRLDNCNTPSQWLHCQQLLAAGLPDVVV